MNDIDVYLHVHVGSQRVGQVADQENNPEAFSCSVCPSAGVPTIHKVKNLLLVVQDEDGA